MRKSKLFTPAMDNMIRELYPECGGAKTALQINEQYGKDFISGQISDRARSLGVQSARGKNTWKAVAPIFDNYPEGFIGPCPHKAGSYLITGKSESYRFSNGKLSYNYPARCLSCGKDYVLLLPSLMKSKKERRFGCNACAKKYRSEILRSRKWQDDQKSAQARNEWIGIMKLWPVASTVAE